MGIYLLLVPVHNPAEQFNMFGNIMSSLAYPNQIVNNFMFFKKIVWFPL